MVVDPWEAMLSEEGRGDAKEHLALFLLQLETPEVRLLVESCFEGLREVWIPVSVTVARAVVSGCVTKVCKVSAECSVCCIGPCGSGAQIP